MLNAAKLYLHFGCLAGDAIFCPNFFCILLFKVSYFVRKSRITYDYIQT